MITVKWKKHKTWGTIWTLLRVAFGLLFNLIKNRGVVKSEVLVKEGEAAYYADSDQSDVLKLYGFKGLAQIKMEGYTTSADERMLGFRYVNGVYQFGVHERINGERLNFDPTKIDIEFGKWTRVPDLKPVRGLFIFALPFFGGKDNNNDGFGGRAPKDVKFYMRFI